MPSVRPAGFRSCVVRAAALAGALLLFVPTLLAPARAATAPACGDRFVVIREQNAPILIGASTEAEIIVVQGLATPPAQISISSGCPLAPLRVKLSKRGAVMKATWPANGCGVDGRTRLRATLAPACQLSGVLKKRKSKPLVFRAAPSTCGDGVLDAGRPEQCEPNLGCTGGRRCGTDCRCTSPVTIVTLPPRPPTTLPNGGTTVTTTVTTTTSTTQPSTGACGNATAPTCNGTCAGDYVCTIGACVDDFQQCFDNLDCDSNYCFVDFGLCASVQSCFVNDECFSGLCGTFSSCFCWYF